MRNLAIICGLLWFSSGLFAGGPDADWNIFADRPTRFKKESVAAMPLGPASAGVTEYLYSPGVLFNPDLGGLSATEENYTGFHGTSIYWQKFYWNGFNISDPANPGLAVIDMPKSYWGEMQFVSMFAPHSKKRGTHFLSDTSLQGYTAQIGIPFFVGGPKLFPDKLMDREPATLWGAPDEARRLHYGFEGSARGVIEGVGGLKASRLFYFAEHIGHQKEYALDRSGPGYKTTAIVDYYPNIAKALKSNKNYGTSYHLAYQHLAADRAGLEWGHGVEQSVDLQKHGVVFGIKQNAGKLKSDRVYTVVHADRTSNAKFLKQSLEAELHNGPLPTTGDRTAFFWEESLQYNFYNNQAHSQRFTGSFGHSLVFDRHGIPNNQIGTTLGNTGTQLTRLDDPVWAETYILNYRLVYEYSYQTRTNKIDVWTGGDLAGSFHSRGLARLFPNWLAGYKQTLSSRDGTHNFFYSLSQESVPLSYLEAGFENDQSASGKTYEWLDIDQNGSFSPGERGGTLARTGGRYHDYADDLKTPAIDEAGLGYLVNFTKSTGLVFQIFGRLFRDLYQVRYKDTKNKPEYDKVDRNNKLGYAFNRTDSNFGQERYELKNHTTDAFLIGIELQIFSKRLDDTWFINFSLSKLAQLAVAPPGQGPFVNDIGYFDESTADPNGRQTEIGVTDYDRGYYATLLFGCLCFDNFVWTNSFHYRDGQAFGSHTIESGLSQGPVLLLQEDRANGLIGIGRFTFFLSWDMRFNYTWESAGDAFSLSLDIYNLINTRVELKERILEDRYYRDPTELIPERYVRIMAHYRLGSGSYRARSKR